MAAVKISAADEEAIIRQRYLTQMTVPKGQLPLKVLTKKYLQLVEAADKGNEADMARQHREFLREVAQMELLAKKLRAVCAANQREQASYTQKQEELEAAIAQTRQEIEDKKVELKHAKEVLDQNQQYEVFRDLISKQPSREVTQHAIDAEVKHIEELKHDDGRIAQVMERRRKQFSLLFYVIEELTRTSDSAADELAAVDAMDVDGGAA